MIRDKRAQGFLEIIISLALISIVILGARQVLEVGMMSVYNNNQEIAAATLARGLMEEIMSKKFDENNSSPWTAPANLGFDTGETRFGTPPNGCFDDVDDYSNNYTEPTPPLTIGNQVMNGQGGTPNYTGFSRTVVVEYVNADMSVSGTQTDFKRVTVTVTAAGIVKTVLVEVIVNL